MTVTKVTIRKVIAVLKEPRNTDLFIQYADDIHDSMAAKPRYAGLAAKLLLLDAEVTDLHKAQIAATTTPPTGTFDDRDVKRTIVHDRLLGLKIDVQLLADADKPNAKTIIEEAGMQVKGEATRGKRKNNAKNGAEDGQAILESEGTGPHNWRYSDDNMLTWNLLPGTRGGRGIVNHLKSGVKYWFQSQQILTKGKEAPWGAPFSLRVN
jgi:hypothetical protein